MKAGNALDTDIKTVLMSDINDRISLDDKYLGRSVTAFERMIAEYGVFAARSLGTGFSNASENAVIGNANGLFSSLFDKRLPELVGEILTDSRKYRNKIDRYESSLNLPETVDFDAQGNFEHLTQNDVIRRRERNFVVRAMLTNRLSGDSAFRVVDLGGGGGRIFHMLGDTLSKRYSECFYQVIGVDVSFDNTQYAASGKARGEYENRLMNVTADITDVPIESNSVNMCCLNSVMQLIPVYRRPLALVEMVRILKQDGEGVITGPNEKCSLDTYIRNTLASQPALYLDPIRMAKAMQIAHVAVRIDDRAQKRADYKYPRTAEMCEAIERLGCEVIRVESWPWFYEGEDFFSAIHFFKKKK